MQQVMTINADPPAATTRLLVENQVAGTTLLEEMVKPLLPEAVWLLVTVQLLLKVEHLASTAPRSLLVSRSGLLPPMVT